MNNQILVIGFKYIFEDTQLIVLCVGANAKWKIAKRFIVTFEQSNTITWRLRSLEKIEKYFEICNSQLKCVDFPCEFRNCADKMCNDVDHRKFMDKLYENIITILSYASI